MAKSKKYIHDSCNVVEGLYAARNAAESVLHTTRIEGRTGTRERQLLDAIEKMIDRANATYA